MTSWGACVSGLIETGDSCGECLRSEVCANGMHQRAELYQHNFYTLITTGVIIVVLWLTVHGEECRRTLFETLAANTMKNNILFADVNWLIRRSISFTCPRGTIVHNSALLGVRVEPFFGVRKLLMIRVVSYGGFNSNQSLCSNRNRNHTPTLPTPLLT